MKYNKFDDDRSFDLETMHAAQQYCSDHSIGQSHIASGQLEGMLIIISGNLSIAWIALDNAIRSGFSTL